MTDEEFNKEGERLTWLARQQMSVRQQSVFYRPKPQGAPMDDHTRRDVDEACLRLLGFDPRWDAGNRDWVVMFGGVRRFRSPSSDRAFVVPLAEALRARGYSLDIWGGSSGWRVVIGPENLIETEADTLPEAIAFAAARAVGTETEG